MKHRWTTPLMFALVACGSPPVKTLAPVSVAEQVVVPPKLEADVVTERTTYAFRASPIANLVYQIDCISGMTRCSHEAYEDLWRSKLGLDERDRAALAEWREMHQRYHGAIETKHDATSLPLFGGPLGLPGRLRVAALTARDEDDALTRLGLFVSDADVDRARSILERFRSRFETFWTTRKSDLAAQVADFERVMQRADVRALADGIATFYGPDIPPRARLTIELVARPEHASADHGEQLGNVSLVEVLPNASAESRLSVILHEAFHFWLGEVPPAKQKILADGFLASESHAALPAYGLLDESLAAAFGQGMVQRLVARGEFDKRVEQPRGLYNDDAVDATAKAILPVLDARVAARGTLLEPTFVDAYVHAVEGALPKLAPRLFLTPMVSLYDPALTNAEFHLYDAVGSRHVESDDNFDKDGLRLLHAHPAWGTVFAVRPATLESLVAVSGYVPPSAMAKLRVEAKRPPFVMTMERKKAGPVFVFVSTDEPEMTAMDDAFAALDSIVAGIWRPR